VSAKLSLASGALFAMFGATLARAAQTRNATLKGFLQRLRVSQDHGQHASQVDSDVSRIGAFGQCSKSWRKICFLRWWADCSKIREPSSGEHDLNGA